MIGKNTKKKERKIVQTKSIPKIFEKEKTKRLCHNALIHSTFW